MNRQEVLSEEDRSSSEIRTSRCLRRGEGARGPRVFEPRFDIDRGGDIARSVRTVCSGDEPDAAARPKWRKVRVRAVDTHDGDDDDETDRKRLLSKDKTERTAQVREVFEQLRAGQKAVCLSPLHRASARRGEGNGETMVGGRA